MVLVLDYEWTLSYPLEIPSSSHFPAAHLNTFHSSSILTESSFHVITSLSSDIIACTTPSLYTRELRFWVARGSSYSNLIIPMKAAFLDSTNKELSPLLLVLVPVGLPSNTDDLG